MNFSTEFSTPNENKPENNYWLITFADLISLMVAFFVMLYSMANPKEQDFKFKVEAIESKSMVVEVKGEQASKFGLHRTFAKRALGLNYLEAVLSSKIEDNEMFKGLLLTSDDEHLIISMPIYSFLETKNGQVIVKKEKERVFFELFDMLSNIKNKISIMAFLGYENNDNDISVALSYAGAVYNQLKANGYKASAEILSSKKNRLFSKLNLKEIMKDVYKNRIDIVIKSDGDIID